MTFNIPEENQYDFAKKQIASNRKIIFLFIGVFCVWLLFKIDLSKVTMESFFALIPLMLFGFLVPYIFIFNHLNMAESIYFSIGNGKIEESLSEKSLGFANKVGLERAKRRYNAEPNKTIHYSEISKIEFSEHKISIYSNSYNWFNGNGKIVIPCEINGYEKAYKAIEKISEDI